MDSIWSFEIFANISKGKQANHFAFVVDDFPIFKTFQRIDSVVGLATVNVTGKRFSSKQCCIGIGIFKENLKNTKNGEKQKQSFHIFKVWIFLLNENFFFNSRMSYNYFPNGERNLSIFNFLWDINARIFIIELFLI